MITAFIASFGYVFLRAIQQLNVQHDFKLYVIPTALLISMFEVTVVLNTVRVGSLDVAIPVGLGGGLGCLTAMTLYKRQ